MARGGTGLMGADAKGDDDVPGEGADGGRSLGATAGLVLWWVVLTGVVLGAIGVVTAQGTVLSAGFVTDELADQDTYGELEATVEDELLDRRAGELLGGAGTGVVPGAERVVATTVREAITEAYVRNTTTRNVRALYAYLHGERPLELGVDTRPLTADVDTVVTERIRGFPVTQLLTGSSFAAAFSGIDGVTVEDVAAAYENRTRYRALQTRVRGVYEARDLDRDQLNRSLQAQTPVDGLPRSVREPVYRLEGITVLALTSDMPPRGVRGADGPGQGRPRGRFRRVRTA